MTFLKNTLIATTAMTFAFSSGLAVSAEREVAHILGPKERRRPIGRRHLYTTVFLVTLLETNASDRAYDRYQPAGLVCPVCIAMALVDHETLSAF